MEEQTKEVYFNIYCELCRYEDNAADEDPCNECLTNFVNAYSHKPVKFVDKD